MRAPDKIASAMRNPYFALTEELTAHPDEPVTETVGRLGESAAGRLIVMENGRMVGLVTLRAVLRWIAMTRAEEKKG